MNGDVTSTDPAARYRSLVADLVAAANRRDTATAAAQQSHAAGTAALEHDLAAAQQSADRAAQRAGQAQRIVASTDLAASALWDELKQSRGRRGRRLGPLPGPMADLATGQADRPRAAAEPGVLLESASARVARARKGGEQLPLLMLPLLFLVGVAASAAVAALALMLGWLLLAAAPVAGLLPARWWVDQRYAARLDPGAIGLVVLGGMLATALVWTSLR